MLCELYKKVQLEGKAFECVFVSSDRSEDAYDEYFGTMPFVAIPYNDPRCKQLTKHFDVQGKFMLLVNLIHIRLII